MSIRTLAMLLLACAPVYIAAQDQPTSARTPIAPPPPQIDPELERAMNSGPRGSLAVRAVQGTKGGPEVGAADVEIELFHRNEGVLKLNSRLDDHGVVVVQDIPLGLSVRPVVRVKYANATYQDVAPQMDASHLTAAIDVTVYEVTDQAPQWHLTERNVMIASTPPELDIVETVEVENPSDRTWMGAPADEQGRRATVSFMIPAAAKDIQLEFGFHGWCCTTFKDGRLTVQMPLMPGKSPFRYSYRLATASGSSEIIVGASAIADLVTFMVADDGSKVDCTALEPAATRMMGQTKVRTYQARRIATDATVGVRISNLPEAAAPSATIPASGVAAPRRASWLDGSTPLYIALGVGAAILGGALYLYLRAPGDRRTKA